MISIQDLLDEYGESHRNPVNKRLHWVCVPAIVWSVIALLWALPFPPRWQTEGVPLNWALLALALSQVYYFRLSVPLGFGVLMFNVLLLWLASIVDLAAVQPLWAIAVTVFITAWIGQFIGHAVEGKRPSFFKDLQFLLIGPAWLVAHLYRRLGLEY